MSAGPELSAATAESDALRRSRLRRMKAVATGFLVLAAVVYLVTLDQDGVLGFLNAGAEAAMVGALADWFAVTALFRHPLGIPIPHTALIRTRKDALGASLEEFVSTNFLSEPVVREKLGRAQLPARLGRWLSQPESAAWAAAEGTAIGQAVLTRVRDEDVVFLLEGVLLPRVSALPVGPVLGSVLDGVLDDRTHVPLLELGLDELHAWLLANEDRVIAIVTDQAPAWSPRWVDKQVGRRVYREVRDWIAEVRADPDHDARRALDDLLRSLARDLREDPETQARVKALAARLLASPDMREGIVAVWGTVRRLLVDAASDPEGELRRRIQEALVELGETLSQPGSELAERLDRVIGDAAGYVVRNYAREIAQIISETVQRWDADDASRRIELYVGRDLQFIRINGTVVGALAGVAIHTVTVLLS